MSSTQSAQVAQRRATVMDLAQSHGWKVAELRVPPMVEGYASAPHLVAWRDGVRLLVLVRSVQAARKNGLSDGQWSWIEAWGPDDVVEVDTSPQSLQDALGVFSRPRDPSEVGFGGESATAGPLPEGPGS